MITTATTIYTPAPVDYVVVEAEAQPVIIGTEPLPRGTVYLLHFDRPISPKHTAQHYIGWTSYLPGRALAHLQGRGARLTQVARERGIGFVIARTWPGDRYFERYLKNRKNAPKLCPICNTHHDLDHLDALI
jgi:predicted GIY-YIG superfamily endonuclease